MPFDTEQATALAQVRVPCPWCERVLRPCNLSRHIATGHFRQLTIYEAIRDAKTKAA